MSLVRSIFQRRDASNLLTYLQLYDNNHPSFAATLERVRAVLADVLGAKAARRATRGKALALPTRAPRRPGGWSTKRLRLAVWQRSEGHCENDECGARITWSTFDLDHYLGRARAVQGPENCWALCQVCHDRKHAGEPNRVHWLRVFLLHLAAHGFGRSETTRKVESELEGERLIAKAAALRAGAVNTAEGLAARAGPEVVVHG